MKADISTLHKPDILTLQRQNASERLTPHPTPVTLFRVIIGAIVDDTIPIALPDKLF